MHQDPPSPHPLVRVRRHPERGDYDQDTIYAIVDEAIFCHVAVIRDGIPIILPMLHVRYHDRLYLHGAQANGLFQNMKGAPTVSVSVTLLDGLVMARSAYHHSMNYRSVVAFGIPEEVIHPDHKMKIFEALFDHLTPGRFQDARLPSAEELKSTRLFGIPLDKASAKLRTGPPLDNSEDLDRPTWAGVLPIHLAFQNPMPDPKQLARLPLPEYLHDLVRTSRGHIS